MARAHGFYSEVRSIVLAIAAIGAIALIGLIHDATIGWMSTRRTAAVLRVAVTRDVFADAAASIGGSRVVVLPLVDIDDADPPRRLINEYVRRTADVLISGGPFVDAEISQEIDHRRDQHARIVDASAGTSSVG